jgi:signal transduction histidine kinase/PAS domain-containing protein
MNLRHRLVFPAFVASVVLILSIFATSRAAGFSPTASLKLDGSNAWQKGDTSTAVPVVLTDEQGQYPLGMHLEILEDPSGELTIEDVTSPAFDSQFRPSLVAVPNYGYTDSAYWVRVDLDNETLYTNEWLLEIGFANTHYVDLYSPTMDAVGYEVKQSGTLRPVSTRDVLYPNIIFSLNIPTQSQQIYYLRFQNGSSMTLPLTLWTRDAFFIESGQVQMFHWLFFGGILALLFYHLFILFMLKEATYLYFVFLLADLFIMVFSYSGYMGVYIFPDWYNYKLYYFPLSLSLLFVTIILFSDTFLEIRVRLPKLHWVNIVLLAVWGVLVILIPFINFQELARLVIPWGLVSLAMTSVIGIIAWRNGFQPVRFFMLAWLFMTASFFLVLLVREGLAPSTVFNENAYLLGFMLMAVSWSFALADRISMLKIDTEAANRGLQKSEHKLSQILEGIPLGVVVYGKDQKPQYLNKRTIEILENKATGIRPDLDAGRDLTQALEHFSFQIAGTEVRYPIENIPVYIALHGESASADNIEANIGDKRIPLEMWASPIMDDSGKVESAVAAFQDITLRKQVEAELAENRKQLESLVEKRTAEYIAANKELRQRLEWLAAINFFNQTVAQTTEFTKIFDKVVELINNLFCTQDSFITELDVRSNQLKILAHSCRSDVHPDLRDSFMSLPEGLLTDPSQEQNKPFLISADQIGAMSGLIGIHTQLSKPQSLAFIPLQLRERVIGFLGLEMNQADWVITEEESNLLYIFSTDIAQLIENARLFEQTKLFIAQEERDRLGRDLHDSVTQALFSATLVAEVLPQLWRRDPERAEQSLEKLQRLTRGALAEMRTILIELRPAAIIKTPLSELLAQLTEAVTSRSGLPFQLFIEQIPLLPNDVQICFYRVAQEALNNVVKHAQARLVTVSLSEIKLPADAKCTTGNQVKLVIQDDGVGFYSASEQSGHLGIGIMRERAAAIQAELSLESVPGHGTLLTLIWCKEVKLDNHHE